MTNTKSPILFLSDDVKDYAPWYYMKCSNALESLSHIADLINHPDCDNLSSSMWKELLLFNLHNAVWNLMAMYSRTQGLSLPLKKYTDYITDEGYHGYVRISCESAIESQEKYSDDRESFKCLNQFLNSMDKGKKPDCYCKNQLSDQIITAIIVLTQAVTFHNRTSTDTSNPSAASEETSESEDTDDSISSASHPPNSK